MFAYGMLALGLRKLFTMNTMVEYGMLPSTWLILQCTYLDLMTALVGYSLSALLLIYYEYNSTVRMWHATQSHSIFTINTRASVCSVQFHPVEKNYFAFGSAGNNNVINIYIFLI